jgi:hypothetical protein
MNKVARSASLSLAAAVIAAFAGCAHKPAYSEMDGSRDPRNQNQNQNQNTEGQSNPSTPAATEPAAAPEAAQPVPAPEASQPSPEAFKTPSFLDPGTGGIKDLPAYPNGSRVSVQVGPLQGLNTMSLGFTTRDPMDKITAFFERVIKDNKWTVEDRIVDPEFSEWTLKKSGDNNAKVQVKKDQLTGSLGIVIVRSEKLEGPSK